MDLITAANISQILALICGIPTLVIGALSLAYPIWKDWPQIRDRGLAKGCASFIQWVLKRIVGVIVGIISGVGIAAIVLKGEWTADLLQGVVIGSMLGSLVIEVFAGLAIGKMKKESMLWGVMGFIMMGLLLIYGVYIVLETVKGTPPNELLQPLAAPIIGKTINGAIIGAIVGAIVGGILGSILGTDDEYRTLYQQRSGYQSGIILWEAGTAIMFAGIGAITGGMSGVVSEIINHQFSIASEIVAGEVYGLIGAMIGTALWEVAIRRR